MFKNNRAPEQTVKGVVTPIYPEADRKAIVENLPRD
jgi:hypothetical protein